MFTFQKALIMEDIPPLKQIPNLEQVLIVTLLPMLIVTLVLLGLILMLWFKVRLLQRRVASLEADFKGSFQRRPGKPHL
jgi:hypothetical protein